MLLTKYTEALCLGEIGSACCQPTKVTSRTVQCCKSVLIETLKPPGLSHMNLTVQASGRNNRIHIKFPKIESPKNCWLGPFYTELLY